MIQRNAIILAAGTSSRFVPLSMEYPKGLLEVKGEVLIEKQIRQLQEAGISDICVVVGYKADMFSYLKEIFGVELIYNMDYARYNNTSSIIRVLDRLGDTFICSSDNYFPSNVFKGEPKQSYYSALYADGDTNEYCIHTNSMDEIEEVDIGGKDSWYMVGHVYFSRDFSEAFKKLLRVDYGNEDVRQGYWEDVYIKHIKDLPPMRINRYETDDIMEFDTLDELRNFDTSYINDTRSNTIKQLAYRLGCKEGELSVFRKQSGNSGPLRFTFMKDGDKYLYDSEGRSFTKL